MTFSSAWCLSRSFQPFALMQISHQEAEGRCTKLRAPTTARLGISPGMHVTTGARVCAFSAAGISAVGSSSRFRFSSFAFADVPEFRRTTHQPLRLSDSRMHRPR